MLVIDKFSEEALLKRLNWMINSDSDLELSQFKKKVRKLKKEEQKKTIAELNEQLDKISWSDWRSIETRAIIRIQRGVHSKKLPRNFSFELPKLGQSMNILNSKFIEIIDKTEELISNSKTQSNKNILDIISTFKKLIQNELNNIPLANNFREEFYISEYVKHLELFKINLMKPLIINNIKEKITSFNPPYLDIFYSFSNEIENLVKYISYSSKENKHDEFLNIVIPKNEYQDFLNFYLLKNKIKIIKKIKTGKSHKPKHNKKNGYGIEWTGDSSKIKILFDELVKNDLIEPINGSEKIFIDFFTSIINSNQSFKWKSDLNLIAYLFECLMDKDLIAHYSEYNSKIRDSLLFVSSKKAPIKNLNKLKHQYRESITGYPRNRDIIDRIINKLI